MNSKQQKALARDRQGRDGGLNTAPASICPPKIAQSSVIAQGRSPGKAKGPGRQDRPADFRVYGSRNSNRGSVSTQRGEMRGRWEALSKGRGYMYSYG